MEKRYRVLLAGPSWCDRKTEIDNVPYWGVEKKSYIKDGMVFCEDEEGRIIEIQILNLSSLALSKAS